MSDCRNKISNTCISKTYATCVEIETELPEFSEITGCPDVEQTTSELYELVGEIKNETDLTALGNLCLEYTLTGGKIIVKNVLAKFEQIICEQQEQILDLQNTAICTTSIVGCNFDFGTLTTNCGNIPATFGEAFQLVLDKLNE